MAPLHVGACTARHHQERWILTVIRIMSLNSELQTLRPLRDGFAGRAIISSVGAEVDRIESDIQRLNPGERA